MINEHQIVPIQKCDFLSMIGIILGIHGTSYTVKAASDVEGDFTLSADGTFVCNQPVKSMNITGDAVTAYFVADYHFEDISVDGTAKNVSVKADGITLYKAVLDSGTLTVTAVTPSLG